MLKTKRIQKLLQMAVIAVGALMCSCSSDQEPQVIPVAPETDAIVSPILPVTPAPELSPEYAQLNEQLLAMSNQPGDAEINGFKDKLKKILKIVAADATGALIGMGEGALAGSALGPEGTTAGAIIGGVAGGITSSVDAATVSENTTETKYIYQETLTSKLNSKDQALDDVLLECNYSILDSIGYIHNEIIHSLNLGSGFSSANYAQMSKYVYLQSGSLKGFNSKHVLQTYNQSGIKGFFDNRLFIVPSDKKIIDYFKNLTEIYTDESQNLILLGSFFQSLENEENPLKDFYLLAVEYINASNISEYDKTKLKVAISVAYASSKLWIADQNPTL